ncbi:MAG: lysozyme [Afipia felis]|nr:lysozyme [Afipia felis]
MPNATSVARVVVPATMSESGLELVKAFESCMARVKGRPGCFRSYRDSAGVLTIGWGHTNHHLPRFDGKAIWTQDECDTALAWDMETFERHVRQLCNVKLEQHEFDARVLAGLTRRRKAEGLMFAGDVKGALALARS